MPKIQGQSGSSIADVYEVVGGDLQIDEIDARDGIKLTHDMAATVFSERMSGRILRATTGAIAQDIPFDLTITDLPLIPFRVLGCNCIMSASRMEHVAIMLEESDSGREFPIWVWDVNLDSDVIQIRWSDDGAAASDQIFLRPLAGPPQIPSMGFGSRQPTSVRDISIRGVASGFGAGTVTLVALVYISFAEVRGINSRGLPVPGW